MKKILTLALVILFAVLFLTACGNSESNNNPASDNGNNINPPAADIAETGYTVTGYYDENGGFSDSGLALDGENGEKVLTVNAGDTLIIGSNKYRVTAESITLYFYTQPSLAQVIEWWTDYCEGLKDSGEITEVD